MNRAAFRSNSAQPAALQRRPVRRPIGSALTRDQLDLLIEAAGATGRTSSRRSSVVAGTGLDPVERHKLGAHYTPRAYVERLVIPTVIQPLREEWDAVGRRP